MASSVAGCAAEFEFDGDGSTGVFVGRVVVVFEELFSAAADACSVSFFDQAFLAGGGVSSAVADVDRLVVGVVDQGSEERVGSDAFDDGVGDRGAVVEGAAVAPDVENEFGGDGSGPVGEEGAEGVGLLLGEGGPGAVRLAFGGGAQDDGGEEGGEEAGEVGRGFEG